MFCVFFVSRRQGFHEIESRNQVLCHTKRFCQASAGCRPSGASLKSNLVCGFWLSQGSKSSWNFQIYIVASTVSTGSCGPDCWVVPAPSQGSCSHSRQCERPDEKEGCKRVFARMCYQEDRDWKRSPREVGHARQGWAAAGLNAILWEPLLTWMMLELNISFSSGY